MSRWKALTVEQIAVSVALAHVAGLDKRLRRLAFTTEVNSRNELQQELKAFSFDAGPSRGTGDVLSAPTNKKTRPFFNIRCHKCGKEGHKKAECRSSGVPPRHSQLANQRSGHNGGRDRSTLICFKCGKEGHVATVCPDRQERSMTVKRDYVKDVILCTVLEPLVTFQQFGESFQFCFDSGAECSLIKEAVWI